MSYLDVNVMRRFTHKLANSTMGAPDLSMGAAGGKPMNADVGPFGRPMRENELKAPETATAGGGAIPEFSDSRLMRDQKGESSVTVPGRSGIKQHVEGGLADAGSMLKRLGIDPANMNYASTAGGLAGGIGAGLGARGLANLFRSKEDEEQGKTPWWANAAGVGAGVGGAVLGANYLPQLLSMLTAQKAPGNSGTPAAAPAAAPAAK